MSANLHKKEFTEETQLKLEIFRGYIHEWIPVFLTNSERNTRDIVNIFDFFSGPGQDSEGHEGSPLMIIDEIISFLETRSSLTDKKITINIHFNDKKKTNIKTLQELVSQKYSKYFDRFNVLYSAKEFSEIFNEKLPLIQNQKSANLVFLDQYGIKQVTPNILKMLTSCKYTDLLFFVSSSLLRRFAEEETMNQYINIPAEELKSIPYKQIHRRVCEAYQKALGGKNYFLTPFSIKKGGSIYGVIFGSGSLLGLEKFLKVCWDNDSITGEANYDIDDDITRSGQMALFAEDSKIKKQDEFETKLYDYIRTCTLDNRPKLGAANKDIRKFTLMSGFLTKHAATTLKKMLKDDAVEITNPNHVEIKTGAFYLSSNEDKLIFIKSKK